MAKQEYLNKLQMDLELRGRSQETVEEYRRYVGMFLDFFEKPPEEMGEPEICEYLHHTLTVRKLNVNTVNVHNSALRFFYAVTLDKLINYKKIPRIKQIRRIPELLTKEEIGLILQTTPSLHHRAMFMLAYGSGLRLAEIVNLLVSDIDSKQMRIFIRKGKGDRDRYAILPQVTLEALRQYWKSCDPKPKDWLFVSPRTGEHATVRLLQDAFKTAVSRVGITKKATIHTLRHCFATHLLNEGKSLVEIKKLLGHVRIDTTAWYVQLADSDLYKIKSPIDTMNEQDHE